MIWRVLFTYLHLLAAGLAGALLIGQHWLLKRPVDRLQLGLLGAMALGQLLATIAILATGIALATQFGMGGGYYLGNFLFLLKMGLFLLLAAVSAVPLAQYVGWNRASRGAATFVPLSREVERVRACLSLAIGLLALLPLPALLLARGFGN
jgi:putative membrane protein